MLGTMTTLQAQPSSQHRLHTPWLLYPLPSPMDPGLVPSSLSRCLPKQNRDTLAWLCGDPGLTSHLEVSGKIHRLERRRVLTCLAPWGGGLGSPGAPGQKAAPGRAQVGEQKRGKHTHYPQGSAAQLLSPSDARLCPRVLGHRLGAPRFGTVHGSLEAGRGCGAGSPGDVRVGRMQLLCLKLAADLALGSQCSASRDQGFVFSRARGWGAEGRVPLGPSDAVLQPTVKGISQHLFPLHTT